eukprot:PhM_4_TR14114/c0_g1_i1/m.42924
MTHMSIAIIASLLLLVHRSTAAITYTLAMDHAERFCGKAIHGYPTSGAGAPCSHPSPVWYNALGIGFNPNNKLAYTLDFYGESLTSVPVPDLSTGNVALVAGAIGCGSEAACRGTAVGPFLSTRFISPARVLMDSRLLPKFYVLEHGNCRMVELNLDTQISTVYLGTGAVGSLTDDVGYKNLPRTTAVMNHLVSADFTSDYMLPCHQPRFQPKVSHTTGIVTLLTENAECDTNGLFNGVLYIARLAVVTGYKVPSGDLFGVIVWRHYRRCVHDRRSRISHQHGRRDESYLGFNAEPHVRCVHLQVRLHDQHGRDHRRWGLAARHHRAGNVIQIVLSPRPGRSLRTTAACGCRLARARARRYVNDRKCFDEHALGHSVAIRNIHFERILHHYAYTVTLLWHSDRNTEHGNHHGDAVNARHALLQLDAIGRPFDDTGGDRFAFDGH